MSIIVDVVKMMALYNKWKQTGSADDQTAFENQRQTVLDKINNLG